MTKKQRLIALSAAILIPLHCWADSGELARNLSESGYPNVAAAVLRASLPRLRGDAVGDGEWLVRTYEKSGDRELIQGLINSPVFGRLGPSIRGLVYLLRAEQFLKDGQFDQTIRFIQSHPIDGTFKNRYDYLLANALAQAKQFDRAIELFKMLIDRISVEDDERLRNLSILGLARTYHEVEDYAAAVYQYNRIGVLDPEFPDAVFEKSWSFFLFDMVNGALGATLTFKAPQFANEFFPEIYVVRAASFYRLCYYDRAIDALRELKVRYEPVQLQIKSLLNESKDDRDCLALIEDRKARSLHPLLLNFLVRDGEFRTAFERYKGLLAEKSKFFSSADAGRFGAGVRTLAERAFQAQEHRFANTVREKLDQLEGKLDTVISQGDLIELEVLKTKEQQLRGEKTKGELQARRLQLDNYEVDELIHVWNFIGEFWLDELGSYYYGLASACQEKGETL